MLEQKARLNYVGVIRANSILRSVRISRISQADGEGCRMNWLTGHCATRNLLKINFQFPKTQKTDSTTNTLILYKPLKLNTTKNT